MSRGTSLDFVFSNLISGTYDGSSICFIPGTSKLLFPQGNRLTIYDVARGQSQTHELEHTSTITRVAASPCGRYVVTVDNKDWVFVSELRVGGFIYKRRFKKPVTAVAFAGNGRGFALASANKLTLYRDPSRVDSLKPFVSERRVGGHFDAITSVEFSPDGRFFSTCSADMTIRVFTTESDDEFVPLTLAGHRGKPLFASFGADSRKITSLGADGSLFVWRIEDDLSLSIVSRRRLDEDSFENPKNKFQNISAAAISENALVAGFNDGVFKVYAIAGEQLALHASATVTFSSERVNFIAISENYAAITSRRLGELVVWDLGSGDVVQRTMSHFGGVTCFDYSPNGVVVATGGDDGKLKVWDTQNGSCLLTFNEHKGPVSDVVFGESGRTVVTASFDGTVKAFDVVGGRCFRTFTAPEYVEFYRVAMDSHGEFVAAVGRGGLEIYLWAMSTGKLVETLTTHTAPVSCIAFTPTVNLVSGSWDGTVRLWDFLDAHSSIGFDARGEVTDIAVSGDGRTLCIANSSGRIVLYDPQTEDYLGEIECAKDARGGKKLESDRSRQNTQWYFDSIDFSPDGSFIVCGGRSKYVCVYSVKSKLLMRRISHTVNTEFSGVEGYVKEYHGSGIAQQIVDAQLGEKEIIEAAARQVKWCPTGRGFSAATPEGLLVFISADERIVDPVELEVDITPDAVQAAVEKEEWVNALVMSIRLGHTERQLLLSVITRIPIDAIEFVANHIPTRFAADFLQTLAEALKSATQVELLVRWIKATLKFHSHKLLKDPSAVPAAHLLLKALSSKVDEVKSVARSNLDMMNFICSQPDP